MTFKSSNEPALISLVMIHYLLRIKQLSESTEKLCLTNREPLWKTTSSLLGYKKDFVGYLKGQLL